MLRILKSNQGFYARNYPVGPRTTKFPIMDHIGLDNEEFTTSGGPASTGQDHTRTDKDQTISEEFRPSEWIDRRFTQYPVRSLGVIQRMHLKVQIGLYIAHKCIFEKLSRFIVLNSECTNLR